MSVTIQEPGQPGGPAQTPQPISGAGGPTQVGEAHQPKASGWGEAAKALHQGLAAQAAVITSQGAQLDGQKSRLDLIAEVVTRMEDELQASRDQEAAGKLDPFSVEAVIGYKPSMEQQMELFKALAEWQFTLEPLAHNRTAKFSTKADEERGKTSQDVSYGYADLSAVLQQARTGGKFGISTTAQIIRTANSNDISMVVLALHSGGGALSSGPFSPSQDGNRLSSANQKKGGALTTARRLLTQAVLGLAAEGEDTDFNPQENTGQRQRAAPRPPSGQAAARTVGAPRQAGAAGAQPERKGPPPGWLSKDDRQKLEAELEAGQYTPERFAEIEARLAAADAANAQLAAKAGGQ